MTGAWRIWQALLRPEHADLRVAAHRANPRDVAAVHQLRRHGEAPLVHAALELAEARRKAAVKFPTKAERIIADVEGMEQASSQAVADHKAQRFARVNIDEPIVDLCCGVGGDAMSLAALGRRVLAIDRDPLRAWMTACNAPPIRAAAADVVTLPLAGMAFHLDPSRRDQRGRMHRFEDYQPGPAFIRHLLRQCPDGAIKLGPGIDLDALPSDLGGEVEFISENGVLVQAVLWRGRLRDASSRRASVLPQRQSLSGEPGAVPLGPARRFLLQVDPAVERAGLMGQLSTQLQAPAIHPALGLLTHDEPVDSAFTRPFELLDVLPWRLDKVRAALRQRGAGIIEVKTRGKAVNPDIVQQQLRGDGDQSLTVFILRWDQKVTAMICRRR